MDGVRILEVAQFTFVPAAGAVLADWGADVIKIEHAERGDAARGQTNWGDIDLQAGRFRPIFEHPNRGKRSVGLDLAHPAATEVLQRLIRESDVFLTNFLPDARRRLGIDVEDVRRINPRIIYVRGSGFGSKGPDSEKGGFDGTAFWARGGSAAGITPPDFEHPLFMPAGGYGDSMSGMALAGGIAGALFSRERTGETSLVDVSLLASGAWAMSLSVNLSLVTGKPTASMSLPAPGPAKNPIHGMFRTGDGRWLQLSMLQAGRYWADLCRHLGLDGLIDDPRFADHAALLANAPAAHAEVVEAIAKRTLAEWSVIFSDLEGAWAPLQNSLEVGRDEQLRANGYICDVTDVDGVERQLLASPVQFDETPPSLTRAPDFAEHTDEVLAWLGFDDDAILSLKIAGAAS